MTVRKKTLRAAIVGAGLMGRWHGHFASQAGAEITAIVDSNGAAAELLRRRFPDARIWFDADQCFGSGQVDVAHLCTPTRTHYGLSKGALEHGVHVLVEKPATSRRGEAEQLIALAHSRNLKFGPVHQFPFQRGFLEVCRDRARLGKPVSVSFETHTAGGQGISDSARQDLLIEIVPHAVSLFLGFLGPEAVHNLQVAPWQIPDQLELGGECCDVRLHALLSNSGRPTRNWFTCVGTEGTVHVDLFHGYCLWESGEANRKSKMMRPFRLGWSLLYASSVNLAARTATSQWAYPGLGNLIRTFYDSILRGSPAPITPAEILETARVIDFLKNRQH